MYEDIITIVNKQMNVYVEGEVLKAVLGVGVNVDKEELIKALQYDRDQYNKGYKDGAKAFAEKFEEEMGEDFFNHYPFVLTALDNTLQEMG